MMQKSKHFTKQKNFNSQSLYYRQPSPSSCCLLLPVHNGISKSRVPYRSCKQCRRSLLGRCFPIVTAKAHHHQISIHRTRKLTFPLRGAREVTHTLLISFPQAPTQRQLYTCKYCMDCLRFASPPAAGPGQRGCLPGWIHSPPNQGQTNLEDTWRGRGGDRDPNLEVQ